MSCTVSMYHTVYSQVSQKNSSKLGRLKNLLTTKDAQTTIQHQSNPNPGVDCWLYSVWAFPLWFSSFSLVSQRNVSPHSLHYPFYYLYNCPKYPPKKKEYVKNHNLQQYLNHRLLKSTAMGKQRISSSARFVNDQNFLPKS